MSEARRVVVKVGSSSLTSAAGGLDADRVDALVDVNLKGVLWGMRTAFGAFGAFGGVGGDVVNVASVSGLGPVPWLSAYAATKAAVVSVSMSAHVETPKRVRVHALCPDGVDTAMVDAMQGRAKAIVHSGGRLLTVAEIARAAADLVGSRRVVRTVPAWRGGLVRGSQLLPSQTGGAFAVFEAVGRRVMRRR